MAVSLAGDIGGTKTLLRLSRTTGSGSNSTLEPLLERRYASADFPDLVPIVRQFCREAEQQGQLQAGELKTACFAIAGPVVNDTAKLTNLVWELQTGRLERELKLERARLINDFAAIGYGVTALPAKDLATLQKAPTQPKAPIAVIGAGTGLGEAYLAWEGDRYQVRPSEGGHAGFAPHSEVEVRLLEYLLQRHERVSVERVVSGQGIVAVYQFLRDTEFAPEREDIAKAVRHWEQNRSADAAAAISQAAADESDRLCVETLSTFVAAYGSAAGDFAVTVLPYGGLFVAGGIAPKILPMLQKSDRFIKAFRHKGRLSPVLEKIPVRVVLDPKVGLLGAARVAARLKRS
ncbi:MAG: glucokinase [Cyanobacteria bacterium P01_F01_bin.33]